MSLIQHRFQEVRERDFTNLPDDMADWIDSWEGGMEARGIGRSYASEQDFATYLNNWNTLSLPRYFIPDFRYVLLSFNITKEIIKEITTRQTDANLDEPFPVDYYNAEDYTFQNIYPLPERRTVRRILDFGPGFGRQLNIWSQTVPDLVYCGMEAIECGYCVQSEYYKRFSGIGFREYLDEPDSFRINGNGIYHLPTWRYDLLPDEFFDLIICVQVLPELGERLMRHLLGVFSRVVKKGGALYIRDHDLRWLPGHKLDLDKALPSLGFVQEFRPYLVDGTDIHGIPRLWRKLDPDQPLRPLDGNTTESVKKE